jgi:hypothetical protein
MTVDVRIGIRSDGLRMVEPPIPGDDELVIGTTVYRRGARVRLRRGLEGPDAGLEGKTGTIQGIHRSDTGPVFLSVEVDAEPGPEGQPLRQLFVAPAQVDLSD